MDFFFVDRKRLKRKLRNNKVVQVLWKLILLYEYAI